MSFDQFELPKEIIKAINENDYNQATSIQEKVIP